MSNDKLTTENSFDYADPEKRRAPELGGASGSPLFVIFAKTAFDLGGKIVVEWWPVGSTDDLAIAEAAVAGNRHARFKTFSSLTQNLEHPATDAAARETAGECVGGEFILSSANIRDEPRGQTADKLSP